MDVSRIVVFGGGGRAGRRAVAEAAGRGHEVTAVVRDPTRHQDLGGHRVTVVAGDVTLAGSVAACAAGHDAAISTVARLDVPSEQFYPVAAQALLDGLSQAGVGRLVVVGIGTVLETAPGVPLHDSPAFPAEHRAFSLGHAAGLDVLRGTSTGVDWLVLAPPPVVLAEEAGPTGAYRIGGQQVLPGSETATFSYAELAVAVVDEIERPQHHRALVAVG